jgi:hypothetical protein
VNTHTRPAAFFLLIAPRGGVFPARRPFPTVGGTTLRRRTCVCRFQPRKSRRPTFGIQIANALSPCAGYLFQIDGEKRADGTCDGLPGYYCGSGTLQLAPGAKTTQRVLLNYYYEFPHAGPHHIHAKRTVTWWPAAHDFFGEHREQEVFDEDVELDLKPANAVELRAVVSPYLGALASGDSQTREEAMQAILFLAPPFVEDTLLKMLDSEDWGSAL